MLVLVKFAVNAEGCVKVTSEKGGYDTNVR
jgi:hypothetical protein